MADAGSKEVELRYPATDDRLAISGFLSGLQSRGGRGVRFTERWAHDDAFAFGRRSLEVSIIAFHEAREVRQRGRQIAELEQVSDLAEMARKALSALNLDLSNSKALLIPPSVALIERPIRPMTARMFPGVRVEVRHQWAAEAAKTLLDAQAVLEHLAAQTKADRDDIAARHQNPGEPEKAAFVAIWAEAWVHLTGRLPGKGAETNPFLDLVAAAWNDASGPADHSFASALRGWLRQNSERYADPDRSAPSWA